MPLPILCAYVPVEFEGEFTHRSQRNGRPSSPSGMRGCRAPPPPDDREMRSLRQNPASRANASLPYSLDDDDRKSRLRRPPCGKALVQICRRRTHSSMGSCSFRASVGAMLTGSRQIEHRMRRSDESRALRYGVNNSQLRAGHPFRHASPRFIQKCCPFPGAFARLF